MEVPVSNEYEVLRNMIQDLGHAVLVVVSVALAVVLVLILEVQGYGLAFADWVAAWIL